MTAVTSTPASSQPRIVEKAFGLPIVSDIYSYGRNYLTNFNCTDVIRNLPVTIDHQLTTRCGDYVVPDPFAAGLPPGIPPP